MAEVRALPCVIEATYDGKELDVRCRRGEHNLTDVLDAVKRSGANIGHLTSRPPHPQRRVPRTHRQSTEGLTMLPQSASK